VSFSDEKNLFEIKEIYQNKTGLAAYVLGPQLASKMLSELNNYVMIDAAFWSRKWPKYLQIEPAPVVQMMHIGKAIKSDDSSIEDVRNINYLNKSWLSRKAIRLKISLLEFPKFIKGTLLGDKRTLKFDKDEFIKNFDNLYD
jgi:glycosyl transferase family 25